MCDRAKKPTSIAVDRFSHCNNFNTLFQRIYKNFCFRFVKSLAFIRSHFCRTRKTTELRTNSLSYPRDALPPSPPPHRSNLFHFMQFLSKISQNNRFASTLLGLAPLWKILNPPLQLLGWLVFLGKLFPVTCFGLSIESDSNNTFPYDTIDCISAYLL